MLTGPKLFSTSKFPINKLNFAFVVISIHKTKACNSKIFLAGRYFQNNKKTWVKAVKLNLS